jgi:hypothetical protein
VVRRVIRDLDTTADSITTSYTRVARVEWRIVNTPAFRIVESLAGEPVIPPTTLALCTIRTEAASLSAYISAGQYSSLKAVLSSLLLGFSRKITGFEEFIHDCLILTDAVAEHTSVISIRIHTHLNINHVASLVGYQRCTPKWARLVIIDAYASIVSARTATTDVGSFDIRPSCYGFKDCTLWTCVCARLCCVIS